MKENVFAIIDYGTDLKIVKTKTRLQSVSLVKLLV